MTVGDIEIPNNTLEKEYLKHVPHFGLMSPDEVKERLRLDMEGEARMQLYFKALAKLRNNAKIEILLKELKPVVNNAVVKQTPSTGSENAKITIIEFSDFRCPHCKKSQQTIKQLLTEYKDKIRLVYKYFPIVTTDQGLAPSIAAHCANSQGHFWKFHDSLFNSTDLSIKTINQIAVNTGLDMPRFNSCLISDNARFSVLSDLKEGKELGIRSTPTYFINGKAYVGRLDFNTFKKIVERELLLIKKKQKKNKLPNNR